VRAFGILVNAVTNVILMRNVYTTLTYSGARLRFRRIRSWRHEQQQRRLKARQVGILLIAR
jgi:hypothetical protein